jgi:hypothetical protein
VTHTRRSAAGAAVALAASAVAVTAAIGSMPSGFHAENLVDAQLMAPVHVNHDGIKFKTKKPADLRVQKVTFDAHGYSGWHHHPGVVIVAVKSGTVTVLDSDCHATAYGPGQPSGSVFVETEDEPGEVRNLTDEPATVYATFVAPHADPPVFRIEDAPVACP